MHHNVANETICTRRAILVQAVIFSLLVLVLTPACSAFLPKSQTALAYRTTDRAFAQNAFFIPPKRTSFLSLAMGVEQVFGSLGGTLAACSTPSTALSKLTQIGTNTPPVAYFSALFLAGFGGRKHWCFWLLFSDSRHRQIHLPTLFARFHIEQT